MIKITPKQMRFIDEYFIDFNGTKAAIRAGYPAKSARSTASRMLTKAHIQAEIQARMRERSEQTKIQKEELVLACAEVIRASISHYLDPITGLLNYSQSSPNQRAIASYKEHHVTDKQGCDHVYKTLNLVPKIAYIEQLTKLMGIDKTVADTEINVNIRVVGEGAEIIEED